MPVYGLGRWWTPLSAAWLHGGLLHIGFNMMSARNLIPAMAHLFGPGRTVIVWIVGGVLAGFLPAAPWARSSPTSPSAGARFTIGASASIFGLIGALFHYGSRASSQIKEHATGWALSGLVMGFAIPGIDNWAHIGGFLGGYLGSRWLNPLLPEQGNHVLAAVGLLLLSAGAVVLSVLTGLSLFK